MLCEPGHLRRRSSHKPFVSKWATWTPTGAFVTTPHEILYANVFQSLARCGSFLHGALLPFAGWPATLVDNHNRSDLLCCGGRRRTSLGSFRRTSVSDHNDWHHLRNHPPSCGTVIGVPAPWTTRDGPSWVVFRRQGRRSASGARASRADPVADSGCSTDRY